LLRISKKHLSSLLALNACLLEKDCATFDHLKPSSLYFIWEDRPLLVQFCAIYFWVQVSISPLFALSFLFRLHSASDEHPVEGSVLQNKCPVFLIIIYCESWSEFRDSSWHCVKMMLRNNWPGFVWIPDNFNEIQRVLIFKKFYSIQCVLKWILRTWVLHFSNDQAIDSVQMLIVSQISSCNEIKCTLIWY
jgi:hypothetical protein